MRKNKTGTGPSKGAVVLLLLLATLTILAIAVFYIVNQNNKESSARPSKATPVPTKAVPSKEGNPAFRGIVEEVDTQSCLLQLYDTQQKESRRMEYNSATLIRDKYGKELVAGQLSPGDIADITYDSSTGKIIKLEMAQDAWEYVAQTGVVINAGAGILANGRQNYAITENLHVFSNGSLIMPEAVSKKDTVTMRGVESEVYVILLTRGHGYLTLKEYADYLGGSLLINQEFAAQITEDMKLTLQEGKYSVTVENDELSATLEADIRRDQTTVLDLTEYARVPEPTGNVEFKIQPAGALLWLDDENVFYGEPVNLTYGTYRMRVELGGYLSYEGTLTVNSAASVVSISLSENIVPTESPEPTEGEENSTSEDGGEEASDGDSSESASASQSGTYDMDEDHYIIVYSDDDVEIYLDGEYMGVTEDGQAILEKYIGSFALDLVKGDESITYQLQVEDDGQDYIIRRYFE